MFYFKGNWIARVENNEIMEMIFIEKANLSGTNMGEIDSVVNEIIFKDKYDGCYQRPEYLIVEFYKRGGTHNCLVVRHWDANKEIYTPDDPSGQRAKFKKWVKDNSIKLPPIAFHSFHSYFSRMTGGNLYTLGYLIDPLLLGAPESANDNLPYLVEEQKLIKNSVTVSYTHLTLPTKRIV